MAGEAQQLGGVIAQMTTASLSPVFAYRCGVSLENEKLSPSRRVTCRSPIQSESCPDTTMPASSPWCV